MTANSIQWSLKSWSLRLFFILMYPGISRDCLLYSWAVVIIYVSQRQAVPSLQCRDLENPSIPPSRNLLEGGSLSTQCQSQQKTWVLHSCHKLKARNDGLLLNLDKYLIICSRQCQGLKEEKEGDKLLDSVKIKNIL